MGRINTNRAPYDCSGVESYASKFGQGSYAILAAGRRRISSWLEQERRRVALNGLDDWVLDDIGLIRGEALRRLETPSETIDTTKHKS